MFDPMDAEVAAFQTVPLTNTVEALGEPLPVIPYPISRANAARTPARWLVVSKWPADAYGILGAVDKAGKTWAVLDLAVSVVTCTPWFGALPVEVSGGTTVFLGE